MNLQPGVLDALPPAGTSVVEVVDVVVGIGLRLGGAAGAQSQADAVQAVTLEDRQPVLRLTGIPVNNAAGLKECQEREIRPGNKIACR